MKHLKKWLCCLAGAVCLTIAAGALPAACAADVPMQMVQAEQALESDGFRYTVTNNAATIIGYDGQAVNLVLPSVLGGYPVRAVETLTEGENDTLSTVTVPAGVTRLGSAFFQCHSLTAVQLPESLTEIGACAFRGCEQLRDITIPAGVTKIGREAFANCKRLRTIQIPDGVSCIEYGTFQMSGLIAVSIGSGVKTIEYYAFSETPLTAVTLPAGLTELAHHAFWGCDALRTLTIPASVTKLSSEAFLDCKQLREIAVAQDNPAYCAVDGIVYDKAMTQLLICPSGYDKPVTVARGAKLAENVFAAHAALPAVSLAQASMTTVPWRMFAGCAKLCTVTLPDNVTAVEGYAFDGCGSLTEVTLPDSVTEIGAYAFSGCQSLTRITIPKNVTVIAETAFPYRNADWYLPDADAICGNLQEILVDAENPVFCAIDGMLYETKTKTLLRCPTGRSATVSLPAQTRAIAENAFSGCGKLSGLLIPDTVTECTKLWFENCDALRSFAVSASHPTLATVNGVLYSKDKTTLLRCPTGYPGVLVPAAGVRIVGERAFANCTVLKQVTLPDGVTQLGAYAFTECHSLTAVPLREGLQTIGRGAFSNCWALERLFIPQSVTSIGTNAFFHADDPYMSAPNPGTVIYGYAGTEAERYCRALETEGNRFCKVQQPQKLRQLYGNLIKWTGTSEKRYAIYLDGVLVTTTANTTYAFQNLTAGKTYTVGVKPLREDGIDVAVVTIPLTAAQTLDRPQQLTRAGNTLRWNPVQGAVRYRVWVIDARTNVFVSTNDQIYDTKYAFCTLRAGGYYRLRVCAIDENGCYGRSKTLAPFCYAPGKAAAPTGLHQSHSNVISWNAVFGAVRYEIFVDGEKVTQTPNCTYSFQTLTAGTAYTVGVRPVFGGGIAGKTAQTQVTAVQMLDRPTGLTVDRNHLRWNAVEGAASYRVWVIDADTNQYLVAEKEVTTPAMYLVGTLETGKHYKLRVCAVDAAGVYGKSLTTAPFFPNFLFYYELAF